jgi:hypothetical protein
MTNEETKPVENFGLYMYTQGSKRTDPALVLRRVVIERETRAHVFIKADPSRPADVNAWPSPRKLHKTRHARYINRTPSAAILSFVEWCDDRVGQIAEDLKRDSELLSHFVSLRDIAKIMREA